MNKCHYYLSHGLWNLIDCCFENITQVDNGYFWGVAAHPNRNTFSSHAINTPWQQSWRTLALLNKAIKAKEGNVDSNKLEQYDLLKNEVDFQYTLRNYTTDNFVQDLFLIYGKVIAQVPVCLTDAETKNFITKLTKLLPIVLEDSPTSLHTLMVQLLPHKLFINYINTVMKELLENVELNSQLCIMLISHLSLFDVTEYLLPFVLHLNDSKFKTQAQLVLLANNQIEILRQIIDEDRKLMVSLDNDRLMLLLKNGLEPECLFQNMILVNKHWVVDVMDIISRNLDQLELVENCRNIPVFIWPLLLIRSYSRGPVPDNTLLYLIRKCKETATDKLIIHICVILEWYLNFSRWYKRHRTSNNFVDLNDVELLQKAKEHSFLYLINKTTDLATIEWRQVREMLRQANSNSTTSWDLLLFQGYCAIMKTIKAIIAAANIDQIAAAQKTTMSSVQMLNSYFKVLYDEEVTKRLNSAKKMIKGLQSLAFRLEVLENIFSLLFITHEDLKDVVYWKECAEHLEQRAHSAGRCKSVPTKSHDSPVRLVKRSPSAPHDQDVQFMSKSSDNVLTMMRGQERKKMKGFICKKYIVRDIIDLVKECLEDNELEVKQEDLFDVQSSIKPGQMENRLEKLSESVSEATWRLQLVTDTEFITEVGVMNYSCGQDPFHYFDYDWLYASDELERSSPLKLRKKSGAEKSNESDSLSHSSPSNENIDHVNISRKKSTPPTIMNQMLASDFSLVVQCLLKGDGLNANYVFQEMNQTENERLEGELKFTESINDLRKKLRNLTSDSPTRKVSKGHDKIGQKNSSFQSVQQVASQGVTTTQVTNHVEHFLSGGKLPNIQGASKVTSGSMLQCVENSSAIVTIDLSLTASNTYQDFINLLNIASKHCPELNTRIQSPISPGTGLTKPLGYLAFTQNVIALLKEVNKHEQDEMSVQELLRSDRVSFSHKTLKEKIGFWKEIRNSFVELDKLGSENLMYNRDGTLISRCQKNIKDTQKILDGLIKNFDQSSECMELGVQIDPSKIVNYTQLLNRYLTDLTNLIMDNVATMRDLDEAVTFHSLLERSAVDIIDELIFHCNIEPSVLDKKAQQLGFNLSASLVVGCCPSVPQSTVDIEVKQFVDCERIVLNQHQQLQNLLYVEQKSPNEVVDGILNELLLAFKHYLLNNQRDDKKTLTNADIKELRQDFKIQGILEKTRDLNHVDFNEMLNDEAAGSDNLCFMLNLYNLMVLHCYLSFKLKEDDGLLSDNELVRQCASKFIGYNIGQFGFVSLSDVRDKLLGEEIISTFSVVNHQFCTKIKLQTDSRCVFSIQHLSLLSPKLTMFDKTNVDGQLERNQVDCVTNSTKLTDNVLVISNLLNWYYQQVLINQEPESHSVRSQTSDGGNNDEKMRLLLEFLIDNTTRDVKERLKQVLVSGLSLRTARASFKIVLDYDELYLPPPAPSTNTTPDNSSKWTTRQLNEPILKFLNQHSRVLADVVEKLHQQLQGVSVARDVLVEEKFRYLDLLFSARWVQEVSPVYDGNTVVTALNKQPDDQKLWKYLNECVSNKDWKKCCDVLLVLPDYCLVCDVNLKRFKDVVFFELACLPSSHEENPPRYWYSKHISDIQLRAETVLLNSCYWPSGDCIQELTALYNDYQELDANTRANIANLKKQIQLYSNIVEHCADWNNKSWYEVSCLANSSPVLLFQSLVKHKLFGLCLEWINLPGILDTIQKLIDADFVRVLLEPTPSDFTLLDHLLKSIPSDKFVKVCNQIVSHIKTIESVKHLTQLVLNSGCVDADRIEYNRTLLCVQLLSVLGQDEHNKLIHLVRQPLLVIEQLLMNTKLDSLQKLLRKLTELDKYELIPLSDINAIICKYGNKAIDFKLVRAVKSSESRPTYLLDTSLTQEFVIPLNVPDKSQWIPDNQVSTCMCCRIITFSIFNRRHHCRRCGRVVCSSCSASRLKVPGYKGVPVRVCSNCHHHHMKCESDNAHCSQSVDTTMDSSSCITQDSQSWSLFADETRNNTVRDEFSYQHSPDVSLCISIYNLHSDQAVASSLLLDESERLLKLLQVKDNSVNPEMDYTLVIQIIRSLILGAKVKYGQAGYTTGVVNCDRLLSQVDLLHLLVKNHSASLIPTDSLNNNTLRQLRDKLVEEELWDLAIEVSTKGGLDKTGVWAAWGKICLSAGCWETARDKFTHCLNSQTRPVKNPPLVDEICRILASACSTGSKVNKSHDKTANAQEVNHILSSLKLTSQGKAMPLPLTSNQTSTPGYEESVYYLKTYGSHQGLVTFYLSQDEYECCLQYILDQQLEPELFLDTVLLACYKNDKMERLKSEMLNLDPTLEQWKKYLSFSCSHLQRVGYLNTLYDVQLFMQDNLRAAMTCIRFYQRGARNYTDLVGRSDCLQKALKHLEDEINVGNKKLKKEETMKLDPREVNKHMNTINRQAEIAKFLSGCESEGRSCLSLILDDVRTMNEIPTLFAGNAQRVLIASLLILCGSNLEEGFGFAFRIIQDYRLNPESVYLDVSKRLASTGRLTDIQKLLDCIKTSGADSITNTCDCVLSQCVRILCSKSVPQDIEGLIKSITDIDIKMNAYIDARQLKSAYLLAVRHHRMSDVRRIMEEAERLGQTAIKNICRKRLGQSPSGSEGSSIPSCEASVQFDN